MAEYIDKKELIEGIKNTRLRLPHDSKDFFTRDNMLLNFEQMVRLIPAADVAEVRRGKWVNDICSVCERVNPTITEDFSGNYISKPLAYCPHCGTKMGDDKNDKL